MEVDNSKPLTIQRAQELKKSLPEKPSFFKEQIRKLVAGFPGIKYQHSPTFTGSEEGRDRFQLKIPYGHNNFLTWEVIYNVSQPIMAPDFILEEGDEFAIPIEKIHSLKRWKAENPDGLLDIILEMKQVYKDYQKSLVKNLQNTRMQFEFSTLESMKDVEFLLKKKDNTLEVICQMPFPYDPKINSLASGDQDKKLMMYIFFWPETSKVPEVTLSWDNPSIWQYLLGGKGLPAWESETVTISYISQVNDMLLQGAEVMEHRRKFLKALEETFGPPLEYDGFGFSRIAFVVEHLNIVFILIVSCVDYPNKQPGIILSSFMSLTKTGLLKKQINSAYPYSPRWTPDEFAKRIKVWLLDKDGPMNDFKQLNTEET